MSSKAFRFIEIEDGVLALREDISLAQAEENLKQLTIIVKALWGSSKKAVQSLSLVPPAAFLQNIQTQRALTNGCSGPSDFNQNGRPRLRCFSCQQLGHRSRDCPNKEASSPFRQNGPNSAAIGYHHNSGGSYGGGGYGSSTGGGYGGYGGGGRAHTGGYGSTSGGSGGIEPSPSKCEKVEETKEDVNKATATETAVEDAPEETDEWTPGDDPLEDGLDLEETEETETRKRALEDGEGGPVSKKLNVSSRTSTSDADDWCPQPIITMDVVKEEVQTHAAGPPITLNIDISDDDDD